MELQHSTNISGITKHIAIHSNKDTNVQNHPKVEIFESGPKQGTEWLTNPRATLLIWLKTPGQQESHSNTYSTEPALCKGNHYFDAISTYIRAGCSISSLCIHYVSVVFPDMEHIPQLWTLHNHITDGKSIRSGLSSHWTNSGRAETFRNVKFPGSSNGGRCQRVHSQPMSEVQHRK